MLLVITSVYKHCFDIPGRKIDTESSSTQRMMFAMYKAHDPASVSIGPRRDLLLLPAGPAHTPAPFTTASTSTPLILQGPTEHSHRRKQSQLYEFLRKLKSFSPCRCCTYNFIEENIHYDDQMEFVLIGHIQAFCCKFS